MRGAFRKKYKKKRKKMAAHQRKLFSEEYAF
jgi:hypothetical protein